MKRLKTMANELLELVENVEEWDKYMDKIKNPEEDDKLQAIINDRNELITKLLLLDLETRFQYSERPNKAQAKWFKDNWGLSESTLDFYRNRKNKSITKQYNELENKDEEATDTETTDFSETLEFCTKVPSQDQAKKTIVNEISIDENQTSNYNGGFNHRSMDDNIWDKVSLSNLSLIEPQYHTPYRYGDIMEDGKIYVWKGKYVDKELFYKSYTKSKEFLDKKNELGLSINDILRKTNLPRTTVNNALYYPYIKIDDMLVEQFQRKYEAI